MVIAVADHEGIDWPSLLQGRTWHQLQPEEIEDTVVITVSRRIYNALPDEHKQRLAKELGEKPGSDNVSMLLASGSLMAAAQASGFGVYMLATTSLHAIGGAFGVTLPFVMYTSLTKALSIVIGPIGLGVLAIASILKLNEPKWKKLLAGVVYVSYIRHKPKS